MIVDCSTTDDYGDSRENFVRVEFGERQMPQLSYLRTGQSVTVVFGLRGYLYADRNTGEQKCFTTVMGIRVEAEDQARPTPPQQNRPVAQQYAAAPPQNYGAAPATPPAQSAPRTPPSPEQTPPDNFWEPNNNGMPF